MVKKEVYGYKVAHWSNVWIIMLVVQRRHPLVLVIELLAWKIGSLEQVSLPTLRHPPSHVSYCIDVASTKGQWLGPFEFAYVVLLG